MEAPRRTFVARGGMAIVVAMGRRTSKGTLRFDANKVPTQLNASSLAQFVDPLPRLDVARPVGYRPIPDDPKVQLPYYRLAMVQFEEKPHRDLKPTRFWGYASASPEPCFETRGGLAP